MIRDISAIETEIAALEAQKPTLPIIEKLALLYIVRDHNREYEKPQTARYSRSAGNESDFITAAKAAPVDKMLDVLDEHMNGIRLIYPREYDSVMRRIREL